MPLEQNENDNIDEPISAQELEKWATEKLMRPIWEELRRSAEDVLSSEGYYLYLSIYDYTWEQTERILKRLREAGYEVQYQKGLEDAIYNISIPR